MAGPMQAVTDGAPKKKSHQLELGFRFWVLGFGFR